MRLSVVIPALDERESLPGLLEEIREVCREEGYDYEILLVDDGSRDGTFAWILETSEKDPRVQGIRFRHTCGKAMALAAGFERVRGDYVVTMDADQQDDPREIPGLLADLEAGADLVSGWKVKRKDPWHKILPSRFFNLVVRVLSGLSLHDFNCGLKAYRREVVESLQLYGELHRYVPVLAHWKGFRVGERAVSHRPRKYGKSKYGLARLSNGFFDLVTLLFLHRYTTRPLHLFGFVGMACFGFGAVVLVYFAAQWWVTGGLRVRPMLVGGIAAILLGFQIISLGLLAEMISQRAGASYPLAATTPGLRQRQNS